MRWRLFLVLAGLLAQAAPPSRRPDPRPSILLILADDLGSRDLGPGIHLPSLARLAREGTTFSTALAAAPLCSPSRAGLLTGWHPARLGLTDNLGSTQGAASLSYLPDEAPTLGEHLTTSGYRTGYVGKWHLGIGDAHPRFRGFPWTRAVNGAETPARAVAPFHGDRPSLQDVPDLDDLPEGTPLMDGLEGWARAFLDDPDPRPFLLVVAPYGDTHEAVDRLTGALLNHLRSRRLEGRTLVIFTADHGGEERTPSPLRGGKGTLQEGGLRVPLLLRGPGIPRGRTLTLPASTLDLVPTLLQLAGVTADPPPDGRSLRPPLAGRPLHPRDLCWHVPHPLGPGRPPMGAIRSGRLKLTQRLDLGDLTLVDLETDPGEARDLQPHHPKDAERLAAALARWRSALGARMPGR